MSRPQPAADLPDAAFQSMEDKKHDVIRHILPACQPQEGSPGNTFTVGELIELQAALPKLIQEAKPKKQMNIVPRKEQDTETSQITTNSCMEASLDSGDAPSHSPRDIRERCRSGAFVGPTNGYCPGFLQCNLVALPQGQSAFDFLLFCQRNPKACPLVEVCDVGSSCPGATVAFGADLKTDLPQYSIYINGKLDQEVTDVTTFWPDNSVAFLIGCSFSYDGALLDAGIPLRSAEQGKNVPMYKTSLKCRPAGSLHGNMVVSMKPISALQVAKEVDITSKYPLAHGGPVCIGNPACIGILDMDRPDWGDAIQCQPHEVPVFHACGVTPQSVLMESKVPFAITHSAGHMFITDLPADMEHR